MGLMRRILTGQVRRPAYQQTVEVDGQSVDINLDGTGYSSGGDTFFAFDLTDGNFSGDSLIIGGQAFDVIEKDGVTYVKNIGSGS